jgi:hypothetical protein
MKTITWRRNSTEAWQPSWKGENGVTQYPTEAIAHKESWIIRSLFPEAEVVILDAQPL